MNNIHSEGEAPKSQVPLPLLATAACHTRKPDFYTYGVIHVGNQSWPDRFYNNLTTTDTKLDKIQNVFGWTFHCSGPIARCCYLDARTTEQLS